MVDDIHVVVPHHRKVRRRPGVRIERLRDYSEAVQANLSPPRVRVEHALVRVASAARSDDAAVAFLAASGALSVLERRYLVHVERAHGLPRARRQRPERSSSRTTIRDVEYVGQALVLELDGRLGHEWAQDRWDDMDRDLHSATTGRLTLRAGWGQVLQPCRFAGILAVVLAARGWTGAVRACGPSCALA